MRIFTLGLCLFVATAEILAEGSDDDWIDGELWGTLLDSVQRRAAADENEISKDLNYSAAEEKNYSPIHGEAGTTNSHLEETHEGVHEEGKEGHGPHNEAVKEHHQGHGVKVASFKFEYVRAPLVITSFVVIIGIFKLLYHHTHYVQRVIPESCCLVILGTLLGFFFLWDDTHESIKFLEFDSKTFFFFLLPPIILESAYSLKDRAFLDNLGTIVLYAVVGTILNITIIGGFLVVFANLGLMGGFVPEPLDCLIFASLIAAVDPVAVLAIFQEVGVNKMLYFMVFGESLLNDAVTVVCYNLVNEFKELETITIWDCFMGILAFLCVSLGGLSIGIFFGVLSAFITRFTEHVRVVEPVVLFGMAYLSYIGSELFHFSGIIGIITCGLLQCHYSFGNISSKSFISVTYFAKVASSVTESLIFIILGVMLVNERGWFWSEWHPHFSLFSLILCIIARVVVVFFLTAVVNKFTGGIRYVSFQEQFIMAYGGLRGAVSFSLAFMISEEVPTKSTLLSATYIVILFTVFVQGCTIKPLVSLLDITLAKKEDRFRLFNEFNKGMVDLLSQGLEDICSNKDLNWMARMSYISKRFIRPILMKDYKPENYKRANEEKLLQIDKTEALKESLRSGSAGNPLRRQATIDQMTEDGDITGEMLDEEEELFMAPKPEISDEIEKKTAEITKDKYHIRQLLTTPDSDFYRNRNLVDEDVKEAREHQAAVRHMQRIQRQLNALNHKGHRRRFFEKSRPKKNMVQGLLLSGMASMAVQSLDSVAETHSERTEDSPTPSLSSGEDEEKGRANTIEPHAPSLPHQLTTIVESQESPV